MKRKQRFLFLIFSLLLTFLVTNVSFANVWVGTATNPIPSGALTHNGTKVNICHRKGNGGYVRINISINGLRGHDGHTASGRKLADQFYLEGKCLGSTEPPELCSANQILNPHNDKCEDCPAGLVPDDSGESCVTPPPNCTITGQFFDTAKNECVCPVGQIFVNNGCKVPEIDCEVGQKVENGQCVNICAEDMLFINGACACPTGQQLDEDGDECEDKPVSDSLIPTVTPLRTSSTKPTITGSAGTSTTLTIALAKKITANSNVAANESTTFDVIAAADSGYSTVIEATPVSITENGFWSFTPSTDLKPAFYDVIAVGNSGADTTKDELEVAIDICDKSQTPSDQLISISQWDESKESSTYYLGKCITTGGEDLPDDPVTSCENPKLGDECIPLPLDPTAKVYEVLHPPTVTHYCDDGGVKSANEQLTGLTMKRVRLANATTAQALDLNSPIDVKQDGTLSTLNIKYGVKMAGGEMDISHATITGGNQAYPVKLTGVTLSDVFIDTTVDYIDASGHLTSGTYIRVLGGTTNGTITNGMITAGTDSANRPVRGSIQTGFYEGTLPDNALTKGRRIRGTLTNATIENARTTTVNGETRIDAGMITSGLIGDAQVFGTVENVLLNNATISNVNHCFSSGTVGTKGQLNWKEVVK